MLGCGCRAGYVRGHCALELDENPGTCCPRRRLSARVVPLANVRVVGLCGFSVLLGAYRSCVWISLHFLTRVHLTCLNAFSPRTRDFRKIPPSAGDEYDGVFGGVAGALKEASGTELTPTFGDRPEGWADMAPVDPAPKESCLR